uniref:Uncharacterized protein n=1 Tax=Tetranychus urticae TaxID=32264 RepID=T1JQ45_TETUR
MFIVYSINSNAFSVSISSDGFALCL